MREFHSPPLLPDHVAHICEFDILCIAGSAHPDAAACHAAKSVLHLANAETIACVVDYVYSTDPAMADTIVGGLALQVR